MAIFQIYSGVEIKISRSHGTKSEYLSVTMFFELTPFLNSHVFISKWTFVFFCLFQHDFLMFFRIEWCHNTMTNNFFFKYNEKKKTKNVRKSSFYHVKLFIFSWVTVDYMIVAYLLLGVQYSIFKYKLISLWICCYKPWETIAYIDLLFDNNTMHKKLVNEKECDKKKM